MGNHDPEMVEGCKTKNRVEK